MNMTFSQFKPMNLAPISFLLTNAVGKMKEFIMNFAAKPQPGIKSTQKL